MLRLGRGLEPIGLYWLFALAFISIYPYATQLKPTSIYVVSCCLVYLYKQTTLIKLYWLFTFCCVYSSSIFCDHPQGAHFFIKRVQHGYTRQAMTRPTEGETQKNIENKC